MCGHICGHMCGHMCGHAHLQRGVDLENTIIAIVTAVVVGHVPLDRVRSTCVRSPSVPLYVHLSALLTVSALNLHPQESLLQNILSLIGLFCKRDL